MASEWFYAHEGKKHGPVSSEQLRSLATSGTLQPDDLIWKEGMPEWRRAGDSPKLFKNPASPQKAPASERSKDTPVPASVTSSIAGVQARVVGVATLTKLRAEKAALENITLPAAYGQLGTHCYESRSLASTLPDQYADLDRVTQQMKGDATVATATSGGSFAEKAKQAALGGIAFANKQKAQLAQAAALRRLGQVAYERNGTEAGPEALVAPIATALRRIADIDASIATTAGSLPRKRRWRVWHFAAGVMCVSFCVGAAKELFSLGRPRSAELQQSPPKVSEQGDPKRNESPSPALERDSAEPPVQARLSPPKASARTQAIAQPSVVAAQSGDSKADASTRSTTDSRLAPATPAPSSARPTLRLDPAREELLKKLLSSGGPVKDMESNSADIGAVLRVTLEREVKGSDLEWLAQFPDIEYLSLPQGPVAREIALDYIYALRRLRTLDAGQCVLTLDKLRALASQLPELDALAFSYKFNKSEEANPFDALVKVLADFPKLRCLAVKCYDLRDSHFSANSPSSMRQCGGLAFLEISNNGRPKVQPMVEAVKGHPTLQTLRMSNCDTRGCSFGPLADCTQLRQLVLAGSNVDKDCCATAMLPQLTHLWLTPETRNADQILMELKKVRPGLFQGDARQKDAPTWSGSVLPLSKKARQVEYNTFLGVHFKDSE